MRIKRRGFLIVWVLVFALLAAACGPAKNQNNAPSQSAPSPQTTAKPAEPTLLPVTLGFPTYDIWEAWVAQDLNLYEKAGLKAKIVMFNSGPALLSALESGSVDVVNTGLATVFAVGQGIPLTIYQYSLDVTSLEGLVVRKESGINSLADLRGKTVAYRQGSCSQIAMLQALKKAGLTTQDVKLVNMDPPNFAPAFMNGNVDAAFAWSPWIFKLEQEQGGKVIAMDTDYGGVCPGTWAARSAFAKENPEVIQRLIHATDLAKQAVAKDPSLAVKALATRFGISESLAKTIFERAKVPTFQEQVAATGPWSVTAREGGLVKAFDLAATIYTAEGTMKPVPLSKWQETVDPSFLEAYAKKPR